MLTVLARAHIPNALTVLRLFLAAGFFAALGCYRYPDTGALWGNLAIALFIVAATTDALDGALARKWNVVSTFGRLMDPFCDKVLILGAFVYLAGPRFIVPESDGAMATGVYPWMVVIVLARELLVTGIRAIVEAQGVKFGSMVSGKAKMILQSIVIPIVLFLVINLDLEAHGWARGIVHGTVWLTVVVTVWSGVPYVMAMRKLGPAA